MNVGLRTGVLPFYLLVISISIFAQPKSSDSGRRLTLDVVVTNNSGKAVEGLGEQDFSVFENDHPLKIASWHAVGGQTASGAADQTKLPTTEPPLKVILVVDEVNSNFSKVTHERAEIRKFLLQNNAKLTYPLSIVFFGNDGIEMQNSSSFDGNSWLTAFDKHLTALRAVNKTSGLSGEVERFRLGSNTLRSLATKQIQTPGRKIMIWISPGWPVLSDSSIDVTSKTEDALFASILSTSTALRQAQITLYNIEHLDQEDGTLMLFLYRGFLKPVAVAKKALPGDLALQVLAEQSGGPVLDASEDLSVLINHCIDDASVSYTIAVDLPPTGKPEEYHDIEVKTRQPGLTTRTRKGYYTQPNL